MCVNVYGEEMPVEDTVRMIVDSLERFADAKNITINYYRP